MTEPLDYDLYFRMWGLLIFGMALGMALGIAMQPIPLWWSLVYLAVFTGMAYWVANYGAATFAVQP